LRKPFIGLAFPADKDTGKITCDDIDDCGEGAEDSFRIKSDAFTMIQVIFTQQPYIEAIAGIAGHAIGIGARDGP